MASNRPNKQKRQRQNRQVREARQARSARAGEATAIDQAAVNPDDISIDPDSDDGDNEAPPITRSG